MVDSLIQGCDRWLSLFVVPDIDPTIDNPPTGPPEGKRDPRIWLLTLIPAAVVVLGIVLVSLLNAARG